MAKYKFPKPAPAAKVGGYVYIAGDRDILFTQSTSAKLNQTEADVIGSVLNLTEHYTNLEPQVYEKAGKLYALVEMPTRTSNRLHDELKSAIDERNKPAVEEKPKAKRKRAPKKAAVAKPEASPRSLRRPRPKV